MQRAWHASWHRGIMGIGIFDMRALLMLATSLALLLPSVTGADYSLLGTGIGWCFSNADFAVGRTVSADKCWDQCKKKYGDMLVAIDWWTETGNQNMCYCQVNSPMSMICVFFLLLLLSLFRVSFSTYASNIVELL